VKYLAKIRRRSHLGIGSLIGMLGIRRDKYYDWSKRYGLDNNHNGKIPKKHWLTPEEREAIIDYARSFIGSHQYYLKDGYRRIAYMGIDENRFACSPTTVYRVLKDAGLLQKWIGKGTSTKGSGFKHPLFIHIEWHTDIKFINFKGSFLFFISVMDGYSRYIVHHELRHTMNEHDVEIVIQRALEKFPGEKPKIISDNGSQYISKDFQMFLKETGLRHIRTSPSYPQSNGKIERFHRSLEEECVRNTSLINIEDARNQIAAYVDHYNNKRLHSALNYLRPVDYLENNVDELLKIRQQKLDQAAEERRNYWKNNSKNNVV
jgi:transposase InsO family protein